MGSETGSYGHSGSSGGQPHTAKSLFESRKDYGRNVGTSGEVSQYKIEHLTTFTMDRKSAILTVADSVRKLQLLDARGKIWTQEIIMMVDDQAIRLIDYETTETLEHFPITHLQDVQPILNACKYDSICALVVRESHSVPPDIYLFQCSTVPAKIICADISSAMLDMKNKKSYKKRPETLNQYRSAVDAARQRPNGIPMRNKSEWKVQSGYDVNGSNFRPQNSTELMIFKIHRDVDMLNNSLDDIEYFVSLLQKSAAASEELTMRRSGGKSNQQRSRMVGNGIIEVRARLPPQEQFIDVFQKFKLCFNLLAKLKDHIKDPNAVELVHYLFSPLAMIVKTCCGFELPRTIKVPLLQRQTISFLRNCTSTKEIELLEKLGDFWMKSRGDFPKEMYFPPYVPRFLSGWEPPPVPVLEVETRDEQRKSGKARRNEEMWRANGARIEELLEPISPPLNLTRNSPRNKTPVERISPVNPAPTSRKLCRVIHDYDARSDKELTVKKGELLEVLNDTKNWWKVRNNGGGMGYVPEMVVLLVTSSNNSPASPKREPEPPLNSPVIVPMSTFVPLTNPPAPNATQVLPNAPQVFSTVAQAPPSSVPAAVVPVVVQRTPTPPPTPPTPPSPPAPVVVPVSDYARVKKKAPVSLPQQPPLPVKPLVSNPGLPPRLAQPVSPTLQQELHNRVAAKNQRNFKIPKKKVSSDIITINRSATAAEVKLWLHSIDVSTSTIASLGVLTGGQLFSMTRDEIKQTCGDEGPRVYSQLMIQRNMDGYATVTGKTELKEVLKRFRETIPDEEK